MQHDYDILITATLSMGGKYTAESMDEAIAIARSGLRTDGEITDITVERAVMLDTEDV